MHGKIYDNITELIGNTPMVRLHRVPDKGSAEVVVKLELFNPLSSVKDRIAISMIVTGLVSDYKARMPIQAKSPWLKGYLAEQATEHSMAAGTKQTEAQRLSSGYGLSFVSSRLSKANLIPSDHFASAPKNPNAFRFLNLELLARLDVNESANDVVH